MPYTYETCHEAFQRGLDDRKAYPLTLGDYKIRESLRGLGRISETLRNIAEDLKFKRRGYYRYFGVCTSDDADVWLKSVPAQLALDLGYNVVPAIKALARDGVPPAVVNGCLARATRVVPVILDDCEGARIALRRGIKHEYKLMKSGGATVQPLVDAVERLIKGTLKVAQPWIDQGPPQVMPNTQRSIQPAQQPNNVRSTPP